MEEYVHVSFDESCPKMVEKGISVNGAGASSERILIDQDEKSNEPLLEKEKGEMDHGSSKEEEVTQPTNEITPPLEWKETKDHPIDNILGDISKGVTTRSKISNFCYHFAFVSQGC